MCIFADLRDVPAAQRLLVDLPHDVFGQVYLSSEIDLGPLIAPPRVQTVWLRPTLTSCAVSRAFNAWASEWIVDDAAAHQQLPLVWIFPWAAAALTAADEESVTRVITSLPSSHLAQGYCGVLPRALGATAARPIG